MMASGSQGLLAAAFYSYPSLVYRSSILISDSVSMPFTNYQFHSDTLCTAIYISPNDMWRISSATIPVSVTVTVPTHTFAWWAWPSGLGRQRKTLKTIDMVYRSARFTMLLWLLDASEVCDSCELHLTNGRHAQDYGRVFREQEEADDDAW